MTRDKGDKGDHGASNVPLGTVSDEELKEKVLKSVRSLMEEQDLDLELDDDTPLFSTGMLGSMAMLRLVSMLERSFDIAMDPGQITVETFDSVGKICEAVRARLDR